MKILVTGADGFIGSNLIFRLKSYDHFHVLTFSKRNEVSELARLAQDADWIVHLAGINRTNHDEEFNETNVNLTRLLCDAVSESGRKIPIIFSSSTQAKLNNKYGVSKKEAEKILLDFKLKTGNPVFIFKLPNIFGKWARPNYNSVIATFCHNLPRDIPIDVHNPDTVMTVTYVDDLLDNFLQLIEEPAGWPTMMKCWPQYKIKLGDLAQTLTDFKFSRKTLKVGQVGEGLERALYATFLSHLPVEKFSYKLKMNSDERGDFTEILRTESSGQFSFFTAKPGVTRGGHYHNTKAEKFLVVSGEAKFRFQNILSKETVEISSSEKVPMVVETIPGWAHDITNVGKEKLVCLIWANEIFDPTRADTYAFSPSEAVEK